MNAVKQVAALKRGVWINILLLAALFVYLLSMAFPGSEAVRLRNAVLFNESDAPFFDWTPLALPTSFKAEQSRPDPRLTSIIRREGIDKLPDDWQKSLALSSFLTQHAAERGDISADLYTAVERIQQGYGACSDFTQAYLGLAHAAGLFAREWAFSFDGYGGHGHALIEVFDRQQQVWKMLDVYNNFYVVDEQGHPLAALQFRQALANQDTANLKIVKAGLGRPGYVHEEKLWAYYQKSVPQWYLWWGNAEQTASDDTWIRAAGKVSVHAAELMGMARGYQPVLYALSLSENFELRAEMHRLKAKLLWILIGAGALIITLLIQLWMLRRAQRRTKREAYFRSALR